MKSFAYFRALVLASLASVGMGSNGVTQPPSNLAEVSEASASGTKVAPSKNTQQQRSNAAKLVKAVRSGGRWAKAWRYPGGGWTVAEGKRRARKARNVANHKRRARS